MPARSPRPTTLALLLLATATFAPGGCKRRAAEPPPAPPPRLGPVLIQDATPPGATATTRLDPAAIAAALRARLLSGGLVAEGADAGAASDAEVRLRGEFVLDGAEVPGKAMARVVVRLQLDTRPSDAPGALDEQLMAQGEQTYALPPGTGSAAAQAVTDLRREVFTKLVLRVAGELLDGVAARIKLHAAAPEAVHAALTADGGELREEAIRVAGQRQLRQEVPRLLELLADDDEPTRDAALGALLAMKDRRAVAVLTRSRSFRDRREMQKIIEAISVLGGVEALDYLSFVADTHDDPDIKGQAAEARQRLTRRMDAGQTLP